MALRARQTRVGSREGEEGRVIEGRRRPRARRMTGGAGRREAGRNVIWIGCVGEIGLVASVARRRRSCKYVIDVTGRAR